MKIAESQVVKTVEITTPDGVTCTHKFVKLTAAQKAKLAITPHEAATFPPPKTRAKKPTRKRLEVIVTDNDGPLLAAIDKYATDNNLPNRGAVLRVAIAQLVGLELPIPHHGWQPGRPRKSVSRK